MRGAPRCSGADIDREVNKTPETLAVGYLHAYPCRTSIALMHMQLRSGMILQSVDMKDLQLTTKPAHLEV